MVTGYAIGSRIGYVFDKIHLLGSLFRNNFPRQPICSSLIQSLKFSSRLSMGNLFLVLYRRHDQVVIRRQGRGPIQAVLGSLAITSSPAKAEALSSA